MHKYFGKTNYRNQNEHNKKKITTNTCIISVVCMNLSVKYTCTI